MTREKLSLIIGMMLAAFLARYPTLALVGRVRLPERVLRGLRFVPVALFFAIIAPELLIRNNVPALTFANAYLIGGLVAWRWGNLLAAIFAGMGRFMLWRAFYRPRLKVA